MHTLLIKLESFFSRNEQEPFLDVIEKLDIHIYITFFKGIKLTKCLKIIKTLCSN